MVAVLTVVLVLLALTLIGLVMLQQSEGGGLGIGGGGSGGGMGGFMTSRSTANLLTRATAVVAAAFMVVSLALAIIANERSRGAPGSILDGGAPAGQQSPQGPMNAPATPSVPSVPSVPTTPAR
ncbi:MAG: preprotein translocase subunit SecG [Rhodospirillales bacterium]|nr:preprotein translocase subunit SecG [Rhodospirillales bacterium]